LAAQIIVTVVILIRQGYYLKKGQNAADKEDIEGLTKVIEGIKAEFMRDNAKVMSDLDILKDKKGKNYTQSQQAIINFYSDYSTWIHKMSSANVPMPKAVNLSTQVDLILLDIRAYEHRVNVSTNLMDLLFDDPNKLGYEMLIRGLNLQNHVELNLTIYVNLTNRKQAIEPSRKIYADLGLPSNDNSNQIIVEIEAELAELRENYSPELIRLHKEVFQVQSQFKELAKAYLNND
jgi:hypothetical protein